MARALPVRVAVDAQSFHSSAASRRSSAANGFLFRSVYLQSVGLLLGGYTFSCHSLRHLIGGSLDSLAKRPARLQAYRCVSCINTKHMNFAWFSLCSVGFSDLYIRLCSMGIWTDLRLL